MQRIAFAVFWLWLVGPATALESRGAWFLAQAEPEPSPAPLPPAEPTEEGLDLTEPDPGQPPPGVDDGETPDDLSIGEIPLIETMELTPTSPGGRSIPTFW